MCLPPMCLEINVSQCKAVRWCTGDVHAPPIHIAACTTVLERAMHIPRRQVALPDRGERTHDLPPSSK
jgi:hypothetical protein